MDWLKNPILRRLIQSVVRAVLVAIGGWMVSRGVATEVELGPIIEGLVPICTALAWSAYEEAQKQREMRLKIATQVQLHE